MSLINERYSDYYNTENGITRHIFEKYLDLIKKSPR